MSTKKERELQRTLDAFAEKEFFYRHQIIQQVAAFLVSVRGILTPTSAAQRDNDAVSAAAAQDKLLQPLLQSFTSKMLNLMSQEHDGLRELLATVMQHRLDYLDGLDVASAVAQTRELQGKLAFVHVNRGYDVGFGANLTTQSPGDTSLDPFSPNRANEPPQIRKNIYNTQKHPKPAAGAKSKPTGTSTAPAAGDSSEGAGAGLDAMDVDPAPPAAAATKAPAAAPKKRPGRPRSKSVVK